MPERREAALSRILLVLRRSHRRWQGLLALKIRCQEADHAFGPWPWTKTALACSDALPARLDVRGTRGRVGGECICEVRGRANGQTVKLREASMRKDGRGAPLARQQQPVHAGALQAA